MTLLLPLLSLQVKDTGYGVSPQDIPHLFTKFAQLRNGTKGGTGLGLAICKRCGCCAVEIFFYWFFFTSFFIFALSLVPKEKNFLNLYGVLALTWPSEGGELSKPT